MQKQKFSRTITMAAAALSLVTLINVAPSRVAFAADTSIKILAPAGPETDVLVSHIGEFEASTGIKATVEVVDRPIWAQRKVAEVVEDAGAYDVVMLGSTYEIASEHAKYHLQDLKTFVPQADLDQITIKNLVTASDGRVVVAPQFVNSAMLFYRKDLFENSTEKTAFKTKYGRELTVPTTVPELIEVAEFFTRPDDNLYGFFISGVDWSLESDYFNLLFALGGNFGDLQKNTLTLDTPKQIATMEAIAKLAKFSPPGRETQSFFDADALMQGGSLAMYVNWSYIWKTLSAQPEMFAVTTPPGDFTGLGGFEAGIPKSSPHPVEAGKFITWMLGADFQKKQAIETGNLPSRLDTMRDPDVRASIANIEAFEAVIPKLTYHAITWQSELASGLTEAIYAVLDGSKSPSEATGWLQNTKFAGRKPLD